MAKTEEKPSSSRSIKMRIGRLLGKGAQEEWKTNVGDTIDELVAYQRTLTPRMDQAAFIDRLFAGHRNGLIDLNLRKNEDGSSRCDAAEMLESLAQEEKRLAEASAKPTKPAREEGEWRNRTVPSDVRDRTVRYLGPPSSRERE